MRTSKIKILVHGNMFVERNKKKIERKYLLRFFPLANEALLLRYIYLCMYARKHAICVVMVIDSVDVRVCLASTRATSHKPYIFVHVRRLEKRRNDTEILLLLLSKTM